MPMRGMGGARQHYVEYDFKENVLAPLDEVKLGTYQSQLYYQNLYHLSVNISHYMFTYS